jgi:hypothetical protein
MWGCFAADQTCYVGIKSGMRDMSTIQSLWQFLQYENKHYGLHPCRAAPDMFYSNMIE